MVQYAQEDEYEAPLKRVKDGEQYLKEFLQPGNRDKGENRKQPCETKKSHHSADSNHQENYLLVSHFLSVFIVGSDRLRSSSDLPNQHKYDTDEGHDIEDDNKKDWRKKGTPKCSRMRKETAINGNNNIYLTVTD